MMNSFKSEVPPEIKTPNKMNKQPFLSWFCFDTVFSISIGWPSELRKHVFTSIFLFGLSSVAVPAVAEDLPLTEKLTQTAGTSLETHIGGQVFKLTRTSPLPNIFGRADIFGRTVDRGFVELRYQGIAPDGKLVLRFSDIDVRSNETTTNRERIGVTNVTGSATYGPGSNTATGRSTAITVVGQEGRNEMLPPNTTEFAIDTQKKKELRFGAVVVTILDADEISIRYSLSFQTKAP